MKFLISILLGLSAINTYASMQKCQVQQMQTSYCYELADWHDSPLEELTNCIDTIEILSINESIKTTDVALTAQLKSQGSFIKAIFQVDNNSCSITSMGEID
jgi:hypothetical protein